ADMRLMGRQPALGYVGEEEVEILLDLWAATRWEMSSHPHVHPPLSAQRCACHLVDEHLKVGDRDPAEREESLVGVQLLDARLPHDPLDPVRLAHERN